MFGKHLTQKEFVGEKINGILPEYMKKHFKIKISTNLVLTSNSIKRNFFSVYLKLQEIDIVIFRLYSKRKDSYILYSKC